MANDVVQRVLGALPPRRLMDRGTTCTIGCSPPRFNEDIVEHLGTPCLVETWLQGVYHKIQDREGVIYRITLEHSGRLLIVPILLRCCLQL